MPLTALQMAALAPMETARVRIAVAAKPGDRRRTRSAKRMSWDHMVDETPVGAIRLGYSTP
jgi:hypothetical protein